MWVSEMTYKMIQKNVKEGIYISKAHHIPVPPAMAPTPRRTTPVMTESEGRRVRIFGEGDQADGGVFGDVGRDGERGGGGDEGMDSAYTAGRASSNGRTFSPLVRLREGLRTSSFSSSGDGTRLVVDTVGEVPSPSMPFLTVLSPVLGGGVVSAGPPMTHTRLPPGLGCGVIAGLPFGVERGVERGEGVGNGNSSDSESSSNAMK